MRQVLLFPPKLRFIHGRDDNCLITITMVNEGLLFSYPAYYQKTLLHALNETEFESHGGSINVQFIMENEECTGLVLEDYWGIRTAEKQ